MRKWQWGKKGIGGRAPLDSTSMKSWEFRTHGSLIQNASSTSSFPAAVDGMSIPSHAMLPISSGE